jgi:Protein of unknown function (DUF4232)
VATARRRTVSLAAAAIAFLGALAVGFGAGYAVRRATSTTTSTSSTSTSTSTSTTTSLAPLVSCTGAVLTGRLASSQGAAGTIQAVVLLTNVGASGCRLVGYPSLVLQSAASALTTSTIKGQASFSVAAANTAPSIQRLTSRGTASFMIQYSQIPTGTETVCATATSINVYVPGSATPISVAATLSPCDAGTVYVSPFYGAT